MRSDLPTEPTYSDTSPPLDDIKELLFEALEAFEACAVDYLLKPIRAERLAAALGNARRLTRAGPRHTAHGARAGQPPCGYHLHPVPGDPSCN